MRSVFLCRENLRHASSTQQSQLDAAAQLDSLTGGEPIRIHYGLIIALILTGCASLTKGTTQDVAIDTPNVSGAACTLTSNAIGSKTVTTPAIVKLEKGRDAINVSCRKDCYEDGVGIIPSNFEGMTAGNLLIGGIIGLGVDAATGAMNQYQNQISIHMVKAKSCKRG